MEDLIRGERLEKKSVRNNFREAKANVFRGAKGLLFLIMIDKAKDKTKST